MIKAFSGRAPILIDAKQKCLVKNPKTLTDKFNILYIENPLGSGFSITDKPIQNFDEDNLATEDVVKFLLNKYPAWKFTQWFYYGESYCGMSMPHNLVWLKNNLGLDFKGILMYSPYLDAKLQDNSMDQYGVMTKNKLWKNCCEKCMCFWFYKCNDCKKSLNLISSENFEMNTFRPLLDRGYKDKDGEQRYPISFFNIHKRDCTELEVYGKPEVCHFIYSKFFHTLINSSKFVSFEPVYTEILTKDKNASSIATMKDIIDDGIEVLIITGEGDFCLPYEGVLRAFNKIDFWFKKYFDEEEFIRESDLVQTKSCKNLTWKKFDGCGHVPADDNAQLDLEINMHP